MFPWMSGVVKKEPLDTREDVKLAAAAAFHRLKDPMVISTFRHLVQVFKDTIAQEGNNEYSH